MESPEKTTSQKQAAKGPIEKKISIETCRECKTHRSNTWHDETKYEANFKLVKAAIESLVPGVEVIRKVDGPLNLGAFEITHGNQLIYSKKNTGLWPNAKAVGLRVKTYFEDLEAGKDVSKYGTQKETAYIPPKKAPSETKSNTSTGFHPKLAATNTTQGTKGVNTPTKQTRADSAGGSPGEGDLEDEPDTVKGHHEEEEEHGHQERQKSKTPESHEEKAEAQVERITPPQKLEQVNEENKADAGHHKSEHEAKEKQESAGHSQENTNREEEHKQEKQPAASKEHTEKKEENQPVASKEHTEKKEEKQGEPAKNTETHEAPKTPADTKQKEPEKTEAGQEKKEGDKNKGKGNTNEEEYAEDFNS